MPLLPTSYRLKSLIVVSLLASMLTACDCFGPPLSALRVEVVDGVVYVGESYPYREPVISPEQGSQLISSPDGVEWAVIATDTWPEVDLGAPSLPLTVCAQGEPQRCYRITGRDEVEESRDGGQTWTVSWQVLPGRREFMERVAHPFLGLGPCPRDVGVTPLDLAVIDFDSGEHTAVVALGQSGILTRRAGQEWQIGYGGLLPDRATSLDDTYLLPEIVTGVALTLLAWIGLSTLAWSRLTENVSREQILGWAARPLLVTVFILLIGVLGANLFLLLALFIAPIALWGMSLWSWKQAGEAEREPDLMWKGAGICLLASAALWLGWVPFVLWAFAVIPFYWLAFGLSLLITGVVVAGAVRALLRLSPPGHERKDLPSRG